MKSKFNSIYSQYILEQDAPPAPPAPDAAAGGAPTPAAAPAPGAAEPTIDNQGEEKKLDTDGFVTLVRLLKDAFVVKPTTEDADSIIDIGEINATNAYEKFKKILTLIKKYNPEAEIDTNKGLISQL